jgi:hypothetical protein
MIFAQRDEGDYRIYGGAIEAMQGDGYTAAVVVHRVRNFVPAPCEVFRDEALACGHRWASAAGALRYALGKGRDAVTSAAQEHCDRPLAVATRSGQ